MTIDPDFNLINTVPGKVTGFVVMNGNVYVASSVGPYRIKGDSLERIDMKPGESFAECVGRD